MSTNAAEHDKLYDHICKRLDDLGADVLVRSIKRTVARGVVATEVASAGATKVVRPMRSHEALAVALEFLVTASQVPLMIADARKTFGGQDIEWGTGESLTAHQDDSSVEPLPQSAASELHKLLQKLVDLMHELEISQPEVA